MIPARNNKGMKMNEEGEWQEQRSLPQGAGREKLERKKKGEANEKKTHTAPARQRWAGGGKRIVKMKCGQAGIWAEFAKLWPW